MKSFLGCLRAELIKTRRTLYLLAALVLPTILVLFNFLLIVGLDREEGYYNNPNGWVSYEHNTITFWAIFVLPFLLVVTCAFVAHQEHDTHQWRRLMCLSVPRYPIYLAKLTLVILLMVLSSLLLWAENILTGALVASLRPELGLKLANISLWPMLWPYLIICVFAVLMATLNLWFSLRANNFVLTIGLGVALILAAFFLNDILAIRLVFPWCLPCNVYKADTLAQVWGVTAYSLLGGAVAAAAGCLDFTRRDVLA